MTGNTRKAMMQHSTLIMAIALTAATRRIGDKKLSEAHDWRIWRSCIRTIKSRENVFILFRPLQGRCVLCAAGYMLLVAESIKLNNSFLIQTLGQVEDVWKSIIANWPEKRRKENSPEKERILQKETYPSGATGFEAFSANVERCYSCFDA